MIQLEYNANDFRTPKIIREKIADSIGKKNIMSMMCMKKQTIGIIMDEVDGIGLGFNELLKVIFSQKQPRTHLLYVSLTPLIKRYSTSKKGILYQIPRCKQI